MNYRRLQIIVKNSIVALFYTLPLTWSAVQRHSSPLVGEGLGGEGYITRFWNPHYEANDPGGK